jgi:NTP pyrophosphatase (non-canonical NTP hydrolase)
MSQDLLQLQARVRQFARERDWEQFHSPRNLATALSVEASELLEHFQWMRAEDGAGVPQGRQSAVEEEMADVFIYLLRLSDVLGVDLVEISNAKVEANARKYPVERSRGNSSKYTEL